jgi:hypothetical protein
VPGAVRPPLRRYASTTASSPGLYAVRNPDDPTTVLDQGLDKSVGALPAGWEGFAGTSLQLVACVRRCGPATSCGSMTALATDP